MFTDKSPWSNRNTNAKTAKQHTEDMEKKYPNEITECVKKSIVYGGPDRAPKNTESSAQPTFTFDNIDSVAAAEKYANGKTAILNFASYKNPGGKFLDGSIAQEECLCHASFLYNVLRKMTGYYDYNNQHKNRALYTNRGIYTPDMIFTDGDKSFQADVITVPAPNKKAAQKYCDVDEAENLAHLHARIEFIRRIAEENNVTTLILGAFGCGVFGQEPRMVANAIDEIFKHSSIKNVILAVPGKNENATTFRRIFKHK
jgi:uncharacterized protein (TIGR02452 family)